MTTKQPLCEPLCASLSSEPRAVAKRLSAILSALGDIDGLVARGSLPDELRDYRMNLHERLKAEGWRITGTRNGWRVLPPLTKRARRPKLDSTQRAYEARAHLEDTISKPGGA